MKQNANHFTFGAFLFCVGGGDRLSLLCFVDLDAALIAVDTFFDASGFPVGSPLAASVPYSLLGTCVDRSFIGIRDKILTTLCSVTPDSSASALRRCFSPTTDATRHS